MNSLKFFLFIASFQIALLSKAQIVVKGTKLFDAYYGWPNLWSNTAKKILTDANSFHIKVGNIGPLGGRLEYLGSDKVGVGLDVNYSNTSVSWKDNALDANNNNVVYYYKVSVPRIRAMMSFNFHFGGSENFDAYWKIAAGYSTWSFTFESSDPNYDEDRIEFDLIPVAFRVGMGVRLFLVQNFNLNAEIGLGGGPLITFGIGTKL